MSVDAGLDPDFLDILRALSEAGADFVVVGAHAMALHGVPRDRGPRLLSDDTARG